MKKREKKNDDRHLLSWESDEGDVMICLHKVSGKYQITIWRRSPEMLFDAETAAREKFEKLVDEQDNDDRYRSIMEDGWRNAQKQWTDLIDRISDITDKLVEMQKDSK
jgi:hypothetical protein